MKKTYTLQEYRNFIVPQTNWLKTLANKIYDIIEKKSYENLKNIAEEIKRTSNVLQGEEKSQNVNPTGLKIAEIAENKYGHTSVSTGRCLWAVQNILDEMGITTARVPSAYMAEKVFDTSENFKKHYKKSTAQNHNLDTLPPGSIILFDRTATHKHGHIEIKSLKGKSWISDYRQHRRTTYAGQKPKAVYIPKN